MPPSAWLARSLRLSTVVTYPRMHCEIVNDPTCFPSLSHVQKVVCGRWKLPSPGGVAPMSDRAMLSERATVWPARTPAPSPLAIGTGSGGITRSPRSSSLAGPPVGMNAAREGWSTSLTERNGKPIETGRTLGFCVTNPLGPLAAPLFWSLPYAPWVSEQKEPFWSPQSGIASKVHPDDESQLSCVQGLPSLHPSGEPPHTPSVHWSPVVHASSSSHEWP